MHHALTKPFCHRKLPPHTTRLRFQHGLTASRGRVPRPNLDILKLDPKVAQEWYLWY